jgi:hypothetical protein
LKKLAQIACVEESNLIPAPKLDQWHIGLGAGALENLGAMHRVERHLLLLYSQVKAIQLN